MGVEHFAGYLTEKALSVDNVVVFLVILSSFKVPREDQQEPLQIGIVIALLARTAFIFVGAALLERFTWMFIFGVVLLLTADHMRVPAFAALDDTEQTVRALPEKYRALINERQTLREMLAEARPRGQQ